MIKVDILHRHSGHVRFTAEIDCDENEPRSTRLGLAVRWAITNGIDLCGTDLRGLDLRGLDLRGLDLRGADFCGTNLHRSNLRGVDFRTTIGISDKVIDGGLRSDGYRFMLTRTEPGKWRVKVGCRNFTVDDALEHWARTRPEGEALGDETRLIVAHMVSLAKLRAWPETGEELTQPRG